MGASGRCPLQDLGGCSTGHAPTAISGGAHPYLQVKSPNSWGCRLAPLFVWLVKVESLPTPFPEPLAERGVSS